jgi:hypothetical protein
VSRSPGGATLCTSIAPMSHSPGGAMSCSPGGAVSSSPRRASRGNTTRPPNNLPSPGGAVSGQTFAGRRASSAPIIFPRHSLPTAGSPWAK